MSDIKFVAAKCPNCGGTLKVDKDERSALCNYCGTTVLIGNTAKTPSSVKKSLKVTLNLRKFFNGFGCFMTLVFFFAFIIILAFMGFIGTFSGLLAYILSRFGI